jgi:hypothetical protein
MTALIIRNYISYNGRKIYTTQWKKNGLEKLTVTQLVKKIPPSVESSQRTHFNIFINLRLCFRNGFFSLDFTTHFLELLSYPYLIYVITAVGRASLNYLRLNEVRYPLILNLNHGSRTEKMCGK